MENYERENRPPFRIKVWERKDLELFVSSRPELARKYQLDTEVPLHTVHPAHLRYMLQPSFNSLDYFLRVLDEMDTATRDQLFEFGYLWVVNPRFREPRTSNETMRESMIDVYDYASFRAKCNDLVRGRHLSENFLVWALVSNALSWAWKLGDPTQLTLMLQRHRDAVEYFSTELSKETDPDRRATLQGVRDFTERMVASAPERQQTAEQYYRVLCNSILPLLYLEESTFLARLSRSRALRDEQRT